MNVRNLLIGGLALCLLATGAQAQTAKLSGPSPVKAGQFTVDPPTLINLGFEWRISGDDNRNAKVAVSYRKKGDVAWKEAMPLMRLQNERIFYGNLKAGNVAYHLEMPNMFAGSILDLEPGTAYEAKFTLSDADGVSGQRVHIVTVSTRPEPKPAAGGHVYHVYPQDWKGPRLPNSYLDFDCAYYISCNGGDVSFSERPRVVAGDTLIMHAGVYYSQHEWYTINSATRPVDGTHYLYANGTAEKPIVIKAAGDGAVIFDGRDNFTLFNVEKANYTYFEGVTFRNTEIAIQAGQQFIAGSIGLTVKHSRFENINVGINTSYSGSRDFYIADNTFIGRDDPDHLQGWGDPKWLKFNGVDGQEIPPKLKSYTAVRVYGGGHVMAYNYVANFHDGIDVESYGNPDGSDPVKGPFYPPQKYWDRRPVSIDYYNNYMTNFHDNAFEIDGSMHNVRVMRNMMMNSASTPFNNQPSMGGPIYWIRNIAFNAPGGAANLAHGAPGVIFLNNTMFTEFTGSLTGNLHMLNNLILGQNAAPAILSVNSFTSYADIDYNGYAPYPGTRNAFVWNAPAPGLLYDYHDLMDFVAEVSTSGDRPQMIPTKNPTLVPHQFTDLAAYSAATGNDRHSIMVGYDAFENVKRLDAKDMGTAQKLYKAEDFDFRLKPGSAPVDKGVVIPNVTDGYAGAAPDLGALEVGQPLPHYGPRPDTPETE